MINELYEKSNSGSDFSKLAEEFSDDPGSANKGGDLGYGRLLPEMENLKMTLSPGEVSKPFETQFGWHIMKVTEIDSIGSFESEENRLRQKINRDSRAQLSRKALVSRIKKDNGFTLNEANWTEFKNSLDNSFSTGSWKPDTAQENLYASELFSLNNNESYPIEDFIEYYTRRRPRQPGVSPATVADQILPQYLETTLLQYEEDHLAEKNPEYRYLLQEYRDGILLFSLMEEKVWNRAMEDTAGLRQYYEDNQEEFHADAMTRVKEYRAGNPAILEVVDSMLLRWKSDEEITEYVNQESNFTLRITEQVYENGEGGIPAAFFNRPAGFISGIFGSEGLYRIIMIQEQMPRRDQTF